MADGMQAPIEAKEKPTGLELLRMPFTGSAISKLPKETKAQIDERKARKSGCMVWKCAECGGNHHKDAVHLDYVGQAALTARLLDADPEWNWEPVVMDGLPPQAGGMWIKLTVCGVSRLGYGSADGKSGGDAIKEIIGDALRNAAMRFGAALDLWHKGDLHPEQEPEGEPEKAEQKPAAKPTTASKADSRELYAELQKGLRACSSVTELKAWGAGQKSRIEKLPADWADELRKEYAAELEGHKNFNEKEQADV